MFTKCPECKAVFRVSTDQLEIAEGLVRCGLCDSVFNGKEYIQDESEDSQESDELTLVEKGDEDLEDDLLELDLADIGESEHDPLSDTVLNLETDEDEVDAEDVPSLIREDIGIPQQASHSGFSVLIWTLAAMGLMVFFLGQITYWQKVEILPTAWVEKFCQPLGCGSSQQQNIDNIKILNRNIYTHPNVKKALMITTSFVSTESQPFPLLQVALLDIQGRILAVRRFEAEEYLVSKDGNNTMMRADEPVGARLEVIDPGNDVIAYEFEFFTSK